MPLSKEAKKVYDKKYYLLHKQERIEQNRRNASQKKVYNDKYYAEHQCELRQKAVLRARANKDRKAETARLAAKHLKHQMHEMYGKLCACCGESNLMFLTLEHRNGQRGLIKKESGTNAHRKAIKQYRPDLYEILCMQCNWAKGRYGICPHKMKGNHD